METIDDLTQANNLRSDSDNSLSPAHFRILLSTVLADRMAYYGLRAVILLYAIEQLEFSQELALTHYGYLTSIVYLCILIGGFFGDLILGARNGLLIGFGICVIGSTAITVPDSLPFYLGALLIALGSGFIRANTFSLIGHGTSIHNKVLLEKRFISMYMAISLGGFLAALIIGYIGETYGYIFSFILVIFFYALSFGLTWIISPKKNSTILNNWEANKPPRLITKSLLIIVLTMIASSAFWMIFELYSMDLSFFRMEFLRAEIFGSLTYDLLLSITTVLLLFLAIPYYFVARKFSMYLKAGLGMLLVGFCWFIATLLESEFIGYGFTLLFIMAFIEALAELFLSPVVLTILSIHTTKRYYGIIYGVYSSLVFLGMRLLYNSEFSFGEYLINIGLIVVVVASIVFYSILAFTEKNETDSPKLEE